MKIEKVDKAARERFVRARTSLLISNGFFGFLALQLQIIEARVLPGGQELSTMAVDGVNLWYNPDYVNGLDDRQLEGVIAHEIMHCCFKHFSRRGSRHPMVWNIAGDFVINNDLLASGMVLPGQAITFDMILNPSKGKGVKGHLADPSVAGLTTEEIYDRIPVKIVNISLQGAGGKDGSEGLDPGGCGGVIDSPGDAGKQQATAEGWDTLVRQGLAVAAANNAGVLPGNLQRLFGELNKPKVSWRNMTRAFIDQSLAKEISWSRISRRSSALNTLLPGYISDRLQHLVFVVDTSGSVNNELLKSFISEVAGALDEGTADKLSVLYADTRVHDVDEWVPGDLVKAKSLEKGGGGTDFRNSFEVIAKTIPDASCIIYLTDLQVNEFGEDPGCPVLWAVYSDTGSYPQLAARAPFGNTVHVGNIYG